MQRIAGFMREAEWLGRERVRGYCLVLLAVSLAFVAFHYHLAMTSAGSDFQAFWGAARAALDAGFPAAYDLGQQAQIQAQLGRGDVYAFVNPPPFLFAVLPLGLLPYPLAWTVWVALTYALWAWAAVRCYPRYWPLVLAFPGALVAAIHAQNGFLTGALLVGAVALAGRRAWLAGVLVGALVIKPHLALLLPFWLAGTRNWRAFAAAGLSATGLLLLAWAAFGTPTMLAYASSWAVSAELVQTGDSGFFLRMATLYGQLRVHLGHEIALAANLATALAMVVLVFRAGRRFGGDAMASGALALAATPLASPYLFNYDLPFLVLPLLWLTAKAQRAGFRPWDKAILLALYIAPFATRAFALPVGINLMPLASAIMVWLIWQRGAGPPQQAGHR